MKSVSSFLLAGILCLAVFKSNAQQDKAKRPSPPATTTQKVGTTTIKIDYSQPSIKGRTIGTDLEPIENKIWRAGANEATTFEFDKDVIIEGKMVPKGKYSFFILVNGEAWTLIFNKTWKQWGAFQYKEADDVLRVSVRDNEVETFSEQLTYKIDKEGTVHILWGNRDVSFLIQEKK
jgi:hypothetical protein